MMESDLIIQLEVCERDMPSSFFANHLDFAERKDVGVSDSQTAAGVSCLTGHCADFRVCEPVGIYCQAAAVFGQRDYF